MQEVYKDGNVFQEMMNKIQETKDQFYVDSSQTVLVRSNGKWVPYLDLMKMDKRLQSVVINSKVTLEGLKYV